MTREHYSLQDVGIPVGIVIGAPIYLAQDAFTREYCTVNAKEFIALASGEWQKHEVMSISWTGAIGCIDPPTQTVSHVFDPEVTTVEEVRGFDSLVIAQLSKLIMK